MLQRGVARAVVAHHVEVLACMLWFRTLRLAQHDSSIVKHSDHTAEAIVTSAVRKGAVSIHCVAS
jgi:hypothetical protein